MQDALHSILQLFVDDIRSEDFIPSYAGVNSRVDFLLPDYETVIETKITKDNHKDKEIGDELLIDIARCKQNPSCNNLVCFIYDKGNYIKNPYGLISDLDKCKRSEMSRW